MPTRFLQRYKSAPFNRRKDKPECENSVVAIMWTLEDALVALAVKDHLKDKLAIVQTIADVRFKIQVTLCKFLLQRLLVVGLLVLEKKEAMNQDENLFGQRPKRSNVL